MNWHPDRPMMWHEPWWQTSRGLIPLLLILVLAGVVIWLVVRMNRMPAASSTAGSPGTAQGAPPPRGIAPPVDPALAHARMRYANGDIDRDTFLAIWVDLGGAPPVAGGGAPEDMDGGADPASS